MAASLKILCAGHLIRHPVGGHTWHHLQYLIGLRRLGHQVVFFEHFGWPNSCYDAGRDEMTADPRFGIDYLRAVFDKSGYDGRWCYLAEDGSEHGMTRAQLSAFCRECDLFLNLSNINWIPELEQCRRRAMVDTDPVFTQAGGHGAGGEFSNYHVLFTYGENVHKQNCTMPTAGRRWLATRQPVVLDLWPVEPPPPDASLTTVINWAAYGDVKYQDRTFGQKDREFEKFTDLPRRAGEAMEMAMNGPKEVRDRFAAGGWCVASPAEISHDPWTYQNYLRRSRGEFCVAKHGYVSTRCGWFSDRSAAYLASGRPVVLQDAGFSDFLPCGRGLLSFRSPQEALAGIRALRDDYPGHCRSARAIAEEFFDSEKVLSRLVLESL